MDKLKWKCGILVSNEEGWAIGIRLQYDVPQKYVGNRKKPDKILLDDLINMKNTFIVT